MSAALDDPPAILGATVDYAARQVTLTGSNFSPSGVPPAVALGGAPLPLRSFTGQTAVAGLPPTWTVGAHNVALTNSLGQTAVYQVALEAAPVPPLTAFQKLRFHAWGVYGPWAITGTLAYAGLLQELNAPTEWGDGLAAYGRRVASTEGGVVIHAVLAVGLDTTLHQDPRYFRSTRKGLWRRMAHAARETVLTHTDSGRETFSTWRVGSAYGEAFLSNLWYPDRLDTVSLGFEQGSLRLGFDLVSNLAAEFWPDIRKKLRRHK